MAQPELNLPIGFLKSKAEKLAQQKPQKVVDAQFPKYNIDWIEEVDMIEFKGRIVLHRLLHVWCQTCCKKRINGHKAQSFIIAKPQQITLNIRIM